MRYLPLLLLLLLPGLVHASSVQITPLKVTLNAPIKYTNGDLISAGDISHYELCINEICDTPLKMQGEAQTFDNISAGSAVTSIKARTVMGTGAVSDWTVPVYLDTQPYSREPEPPSALKVLLQEVLSATTNLINYYLRAGI